MSHSLPIEPARTGYQGGFGRQGFAHHRLGQGDSQPEELLFLGDSRSLLDWYHSQVGHVAPTWPMKIINP